MDGRGDGSHARLTRGRERCIRRRRAHRVQRPVKRRNVVYERRIAPHAEHIVNDHGRVAPLGPMRVRVHHAQVFEAVDARRVSRELGRDLAVVVPVVRQRDTK